MSQQFTAGAPVNARMSAAGINWLNVKSFAEDAVTLIEENGDKFLSMIETTFRIFSEITGGDYTAILGELTSVQRDTTAIIAAIKAKFNLP